MLQVLQFLFNYVIQFIQMLFTINIGNGLSLGLIMCIVFIFLPIMLRIINFIKQDALEELDDRYDSTRPIETISSTEHQWIRSPGSNKNFGRTIFTNHTRTRRRRYRI